MKNTPIGDGAMEKYMVEASADYWSGSATAEMAIQEHLSPDETIALMKKTYSIICGGTTAGNHGTGTDRLNDAACRSVL